MKTTSKPFAIKMVFSVSFLFVILFLSQTALAGNIIAGFVFDKQRNPLPDIDVELLDEYYRLVPNGRQKTDGAGRYQFQNLNDGNYTVRVFAFRYDLEDQSQYVEVKSVSALTSGAAQQSGGGSTSGSSYNPVDFYLLPKKGGLRDSELGVVFAQEIPKEAETAYKQAVEDFSKKRDQAGFDNLKKALGTFPTYYQALHRFGTELFMRKQYLEAAQAFMEAVKVNPKSATSFYYLGFAFFNLGEKYHKASNTSLNQALLLAPASPQVLYLIGRVERSLDKFVEAEKHLLQAKKLAATKVPEIHWELALLYGNNLKKYKEAADELELYIKAAKLENADEAKTKKLIADFREKAKTASN